MPDTTVFTRKGLVYTLIFICLMIYIQIDEQETGFYGSFDSGREEAWWFFASGFVGLFVGTIVATSSLKPGGLEKEIWLEQQEILGKS